MVFAAIDLGSNTLRLLVAEVIEGTIKPLRYERAITRLGKGLKGSAVLDAAASEKSIEFLREFSEIIRNSGVEKTRCVATSALREAQNSSDFLKKARHVLGFEIEVVSGKREAGLTARGVLSSIDRPESFVIVDIGGGSTEVIHSGDREGLGHITVPVGVVKLAGAYPLSDPPADTELKAIRSEADALSRGIAEKVSKHIARNTRFVGTAGTASTLAAIDLGLEKYDSQKVHGHEIVLKRLGKIFDMLKSLPLGARARIKGLEPQRADLIIPGIILTISLMETFGFNSIFISNAGLLEGILLEMAEEG